MMDVQTAIFVGAVVAALTLATMVGQILHGRQDIGLDPAVVHNFNLRVRAWWLMFSILATALLMGRIATVVIFGLLSFQALREFITLTPTRLGDHRALFWVFVLFTPLQYVLVGMERYGLYSVLIPVYGFLFVPARVAMSGDYRGFLKRVAMIQSGLIICVYCLSYAPALLSLQLKPLIVEDMGNNLPRNNAENFSDAGQDANEDDDSLPQLIRQAGSNTRLLIFLVVIVQFGDALQYLLGKWIGRNVIAESISQNRTWEGLLGGMAGTALLGALLASVTTFSVWQGATMAIVVTVMSFAGSMTMSAIKRDRGVTDYGILVEGHGGLLDRIDSLCFAAPVFFHVTRFFFAELP